MKEYRCNKCNKLLFKGNFEGKIEIICNRCKEINNKECHEHLTTK
jgi:phage FluMu protein Com